MSEVETLRLQQYTGHLVKYSNQRIANSAQDARIVPVINAIASDLQSKAVCEREESCVSLSEEIGLGSTARTLNTLVSRTSSIATIARQGFQNRNNAIGQANASLAAIEAAVSDEETVASDKRSILRKHNAELSQLLDQLDETIPVSTLAAFAQELRGGVTIPGKEDVSLRIGHFLNGYAAALDKVLSERGSDAVERPAFPSRTAVPEALSHMLTFAPVALLTFTIDVMFPLTLWAFTYWQQIYARFEANPRAGTKRKVPTDLERLTETSLLKPQAPSGSSERKASTQKTASSRRTNRSSKRRTNKGGRS